MSSAAPTSIQVSPQDQAAVAAVPARMIETWAKHDAEGFSELFTEDGTMILPGLYKKGREQIKEYMAAAFQSSYLGTRVVGQPLEIKPLSADAVALITTGGVVKAGADGLTDADAIRASWILVRREGRWQLAVYQNGPRDPA